MGRLALVATAALAVMLSACGGGAGSSPASTGARRDQADRRLGRQGGRRRTARMSGEVTVTVGGQVKTRSRSTARWTSAAARSSSATT